MSNVSQSGWKKRKKESTSSVTASGAAKIDSGLSSGIDYP
jgi:hypothetical protein